MAKICEHTGTSQHRLETSNRRRQLATSHKRSVAVFDGLLTPTPSVFECTRLSRGFTKPRNKKLVVGLVRIKRWIEINQVNRFAWPLTHPV